jgi:hypothetical protein
MFRSSGRQRRFCASVPPNWFGIWDNARRGGRKEQIGNSPVRFVQSCNRSRDKRDSLIYRAVMSFAATTYAWYFSYPLDMAEVGVRAV